MEKRIKEILIDIAEKTYNKKPSYFRIEVIPEERKSFHGDYNPTTKTIRIFNLSRPIEHVISTTIHELAHHIDFSNNGSSGHNKRFYGIFRDLLKTAIKCGYINYSSIKNKKDSLDIVQMEKYYGELIAFYDESKNDKKDKCIIKVRKSFNIKNYLSENGFLFNGLEKTWDKTINKTDLEQVKNEILEKDNNVEIIVSDFNTISAEIFYYIIVSKNTYENKDILSENGYKYKGYNEKSNSWVKKINSNKLKEEKKFLNKLGLQYKIRH